MSDKQKEVKELREKLNETMMLLDAHLEREQILMELLLIMFEKEKGE